MAEEAEADYMWSYLANLPIAISNELGIVLAIIAGSAVLAMRNDPTGGYWNRVMRLGVRQPISETLVAGIRRFYAQLGITEARLQIVPEALPQQWPAICDRWGISRGPETVKMVRRAGPVEPVRSEFEIRPVDPGSGEAWARTMCRGFGMPATALSPLYMSTVDKSESYRGFAAWDGDTIVAAANLRVSNGVASFCGSATLPRYRGRGAQTALNVARLDAAHRLGCEWVTAETWADGDGVVNPSKSNMIKAGFEQIYTRGEWHMPIPQVSIGALWPVTIRKMAVGL